MPAPSYITVAGAIGGTGGISFAWPAHLADDVGLLLVETANEPVATPSGFTPVPAPQGVGAAGSTTATLLSAFWRRAASAAEPSVVIADAGDHVFAVLLQVRGCRTGGSPVDAVQYSTAPSATTAGNLAGVTTRTNDCVVIAAIATSVDGNSNPTSGGLSTPGLTPPSSENFNTGSTQGNGGTIVVGNGTKAAAGAVGPTTCTFATAAVQSGLQIALASLQESGTSAEVYDRKDSSAASATSINVTMPDGIVAGDKLLVTLTCENAGAAITAPGWTIAEEGTNGGSIRSAVLHKTAVGGDSLTVSGSTANWRARAFGIRGATGEVAANGIAHGLNADPASLATGWAASGEPNLWLSFLPMLSAVPSAPPSGFSNFSTAGGSGALGIATAERLDTAVTLDPGPWTSPSVAARVHTIAVRSRGVVSGGANLPVPLAAGSVYAAELVSGGALLPVPVASGLIYEPNISGGAELPVPIAAGEIVEAGEPPFDYIRDHARRAILGINPVFWGKPRIASFIWALVTEVQELENATMSVISLRLVDNARDVQLEVIGRIVGQRNTGGFDTELYRALIKAKIRTNRSHGSLKDILETLQLVHPASASWFPAGWATLGLEVLDVPIAVLKALSIVLRNAKQAEEGILLYVDDSPGLLRGDSVTDVAPTGGGWGTASNPSVGGGGFHVRRISHLDAPPES